MLIYVKKYAGLVHTLVGKFKCKNNLSKSDSFVPVNVTLIIIRKFDNHCKISNFVSNRFYLGKYIPTFSLVIVTYNVV